MKPKKTAYGIGDCAARLSAGWVLSGMGCLLPAVFFLFGGQPVHAQGVGINLTASPPSGDAGLDVDYTSRGVLLPRVSLPNTTTTYGLTGGGPTTSMLVYNTNASITGPGADGAGFYYWNGTHWDRIRDLNVAMNVWRVVGNAGTDQTTHFLGTTDAVPLNLRVNNRPAGRIGLTDYNTFFGYEAGLNALKNDTAKYNVGVGYQALYNINSSSAVNNVAIGYRAAYSATTSHGLIALGYEALRNCIGNRNIGIGVAAGYCQTPSASFEDNIAIGDSALYVGGSSSFNIAIGRSALFASNQPSSVYNIAIGHRALRHNTHGDHNIAIGHEAMFKNTTGRSNIAIGYRALYHNQTSSLNIAFGDSALLNTLTGVNIGFGRKTLMQCTDCVENTVIGNYAMQDAGDGCDYNVAFGLRALQRLSPNSDLNVAIGFQAGLTPSVPWQFNQCVFAGSDTYLDTNRTNVAMLGYGITDGECTGDNQVLLGNTAITQIRAQVGTITTYSDARYKFNVQEDIKGLDFIMALRPVSYRVNPEILHQIWGTPDSIVKRINHEEVKQKRFSGFIAQEVEQAARQAGFHFTGIDVPRNEKEVYSLRYNDFIMPLVKAMQEQQQPIEGMQNSLSALKSEHSSNLQKFARLDNLNRELDAELSNMKKMLGW